MIKLWKRLGTAILLCAFLLIQQSAYGQLVSDTLQFEEIEVVATRISQPRDYQPTHIELIDSSRLSLLQSLSVAEVLSAESSLFIKGNGPGGLATASQRGLSAEQIQVLWEGIPINSPMLGQTDLSLLPASFFSDIQVSSGVPSTAFGGGGLSGALYLSSDWESGSHISLRQSAGSYGQRKTMLNANYKNNGWLFSVRGLRDYASNDYKYFNRAYNEVRRREHNRSKRYGLMATIGKDYSNKQWKSTLWIADSDNEISGNVLKTNSQASQTDRSVRWLSTYKHRWAKTEINVKNYLEREALNYFDPQIGTRSFSTTRRWLMSADIKHSLNKHLLLKGEISGEFIGAETNNYSSLKTRQQFSLLANPEIMLLDEVLRVYPALRLDNYSDFGTELSPSLGINYELVTNRLFLRGQLSRDFNPPTFNGLYWNPGGNPDLKAEYSKSGEAGLIIKPLLPVRTSFELTAYYYDIKNGIRWNPNAGGIYEPTNIAHAVSKGVEIQVDNYLQWSPNWSLHIKQNAALNRTEIVEPRSADDAAVGKQLRYTPQWKYNGSLNISRGLVALLLQYRWISRRYVTDTEDINNSLDPYGVFDARLQWQRKIGDIDIQAIAAINNIFGKDYEIIQWYAQPRQNLNFTLTATYQF